MTRKGQCADCEKYEGEGHNYCRKCGYELKPDHAKHAAVAQEYYTDAKFCGCCGKPRDVCNGSH